MIAVDGFLDRLPQGFRIFLATFVLVLSAGFFTGLRFVGETGGTRPDGIETNYLGNEEDPEAELMIFRKSEREMLTIIHTHVLSMSMIFLILGVLVWGTRLSASWKYFLTIEPFLSLLVTFGGLYFLWKGFLWVKYVVFVSGAFMTLSFVGAALVVLVHLVRKPQTGSR